jgi:hypothetical protein
MKNTEKWSTKNMLVMVLFHQRYKQVYWPKIVIAFKRPNWSMRGFAK